MLQLRNSDRPEKCCILQEIDQDYCCSRSCRHTQPTRNIHQLTLRTALSARGYSDSAHSNPGTRRAHTPNSSALPSLRQCFDQSACPQQSHHNAKQHLEFPFGQIQSELPPHHPADQSPANKRNERLHSHITVHMVRP